MTRIGSFFIGVGNKFKGFGIPDGASTPAYDPNAAILALGPQLWHDFNDQAGADGSDITTSTDKSGNGYTLTNAATAPTVKANGINSRKVANFSSFTDRRLQNASWPATGNGPFTLYVVARLTGTNNNTHAEIQLGSSGAGGQCLQTGLRDLSPVVMTITDRNSNLYVMTSNNTAINTNYIQVIRRTSDATNMYRANGSTRAPNFAWTAAITGNRFCVGGSSLEAVYFLGYIGEVVFFNTAHSDAEVTTIETALNTKWATF